MTKTSKKSLFSFVMVLCFAILTMFTLTACGKDAHKHEMEHVDAVAATCTTGGNVEYWHCTKCDKNFDKEKDGKEIVDTKVDALGHDYLYFYNSETKKYSGVCARNSEHTVPEFDAGKDANFPILVSSVADIHEMTLTREDNEKLYIRLNGDIAIDKHLGIGRNIDFDLGGHTLSFRTTKEDDAFMFVGDVGESAPFIASIRNGKIVFSCDNAETNGNMIQVSKEATLLLQGVEGSSTHTGISLFDKANVKVKDCVINAVDYALATTNGAGGENMKAEVENSKLVSSNDSAVYVPGYMVLSITQNSEIIGKSAALHIMMGDITVENSKLVATNPEFSVRTTRDELIESGATLNARTSEGAAVVIRADLYYDDTVSTNGIKLKFNNVNMLSASGVNVAIYKCNDAAGYLAKAEDQTTVKNQSDYVVGYFHGMLVRVYNYDNGTITLVSNN